jgi:predicted phage terminase large subunit-like protein
MTLGTRDTLENYLRGILESRLEPAAPVVMLSNRWSTDDLVARIEAGEDASDWVIVSLEALNESPDDPLHRELGEALWPEKWPVEVLLAKKRAVGSGVFNASYQGHPTPEGGRLFEPGWFGEYETLPSARALQRPTVQVYRSPLEAAHEPPQRFVRVTAVDAAGKSTQSGSYSAIVTLLYDGADIFVCAAERSREAFEELRARLISHYNRWQPDLIVIENMGGLGSQLIGSLKWSTRLPVRPVDPGRRSKEERALDVLPLCEAGRVFLPKHAVWKDFFVRELSDFPQGRNDDTVDAFVYALQYVMLVQRRRRVDEHWSKQLAKLNDGWVGR